jgi:hypothetical protein
VKDVHLVVGVLAITLNAIAGFWGAWLWHRAQASLWFWRVLRTAQAVVVVQVALGGILVITGHKPPGLHVVYGLLPILVTFVAEQLRIASAEMVLGTRGFESAAEIGELPADEQRSVVVAILQREVGVMALAALVIVVLLARAAATH